MVPVGSTKKPVPAKLPCSSTPRIFTTARAERSKTSFTSRLMVEADCSCACAKPAAETTASMPTVNLVRTRAAARRGKIAGALEPESSLITHWRAVEHVARGRRGSSVSPGSSRGHTERGRAEITHGDWRRETPSRIGLRHIRDGARRKRRDIHRIRSLRNLEREDSGEHDNRGSCGRIGGERRHIQLEHEIVRPLPGNPPERLAQQLRPLPAMELVQKIIEVTGRRLLMPLETQKLAD